VLPEKENSMAKTKSAFAMYWTTGKVEMGKKKNHFTRDVSIASSPPYPRGKDPKNSCKQGGENIN
jgi:hypothetical protein